MRSGQVANDPASTGRHNIAGDHFGNKIAIFGWFWPPAVFTLDYSRLPLPLVDGPRYRLREAGEHVNAGSAGR